MKDNLSEQTKRFHSLWDKETKSGRNTERREVASKRKKKGYKNGGNKGKTDNLQFGKNILT